MAVLIFCGCAYFAFLGGGGRGEGRCHPLRSIDFLDVEIVMVVLLERVGLCSRRCTIDLLVAFSEYAPTFLHKLRPPSGAKSPHLARTCGSVCSSEAANRHVPALIRQSIGAVEQTEAVPGAACGYRLLP